VDEVLELDRVAHEERRRVVADEVVVALVGVELEREPARVADRVGAAHLAGHGGEAGEDRRALADLREEARRRPLGDVGGDLEEAVGAAALGVDDPLGDPLSVEVLQLLHKVRVVQHRGTVRPDRQRELIAGDRDAGIGRGSRDVPFIAHCETSCSGSVPSALGVGAHARRQACSRRGLPAAVARETVLPGPREPVVKRAEVVRGVGATTGAQTATTEVSCRRRRDRRAGDRRRAAHGVDLRLFRARPGRPDAGATWATRSPRRWRRWLYRWRCAPGVDVAQLRAGRDAARRGDLGSSAIRARGASR
jgi:hypothetical protein